MTKTVFLFVGALALATPALAQQPAALPQQPDTARPKTTREIVLSKMRALGKSEVRDTTPRDTTRADSAAARPRPVTPRRTTSTGGQQPAADFSTDSVMQELLKLNEYEATQYRGSEAVFEADSNKLVLYGTKDVKAGVNREGQSMVADSLLTFDQNTNIACGHGKPILSGEGTDAPVESEEVCYDTGRKLGVAMGARTQITEGANWVVTGNLYYKEGNVYGDHGKFTDCQLTVPHYHFAAGKVKVINNNVMVARNVTLNFGDVPVFWLPFMMQSMKQGRRSGLLMPQFSVNDIVRRNQSYNRRISDIGFYWAINDNMGSKFAVDWFANHYTAFEGSFDYRFVNKFLDGGATLKRYWETNGSTQFTMSTQHSWEPNERTRLGIDANYTTSSTFITQQSYDPRELNRTIASNGGLTRRFDWGSMSMQVSRTHFLSDDKVDYKLPSLGLTFATVTLWPARGGEPRFYNNATWTSNAQFSRTSTDFKTHNFDPSGMDGSFNSNFTMGRLSFSQGFTSNYARAMSFARVDSVRTDTALLAGQRMAWNASLSFQQRLIGTTTFTPNVRIQQDYARQDTVDNNRVFHTPMRMDAGAELKMDLFGFWPGIGPMSRLRHRLSPSISYRYSPKAALSSADSAKLRLLNLAQAGREVNQISIGISQTIEGKYREDEKTEGMNADSAAIDSTNVDPTKPRRLPQARKVTILSLNTDAIAYDFVAAREGGLGYQTTQITNTVNSDLLRGLQLSITHELFAPDTFKTPLPGGFGHKRDFSPHLSRVNASFSLNNNSWLFRMFGLGKHTEPPPQTGSRETADTADAQGRPRPSNAARPEFGLIGTRGAESGPPSRGPIGSWNASFNLSLERPRKGEDTQPAAFHQIANQMITTNLTFQPTAQWNVNWSTGYSFSTSKFTDHVLTFTRQMHDWDANFNFVKAQNGNFSFVFNVKLRANPDIKFDYSQRSNVRNPVIP